jgi:hypothetical protein
MTVGVFRDDITCLPWSEVTSAVVYERGGVPLGRVAGEKPARAGSASPEVGRTVREGPGAGVAACATMRQ